MSVDRLAARSGGVIGTIGPIRGSGVFSLQERHALSVDNFDDVSLYLKMNGASGSTTFYDSSQYGHTVTANGDAAISTAQSKFGGASAAFDGTGDLLVLVNDSSHDVSSGDFTLELWIRPVVNNVLNVFLSRMQTAGANWTGYAIYQNLQKIGFFYGNGGGLAEIITGDVITTTNQWYHIAVVKNGSAANNTKIYINGTQSAQGTPTFGNSGLQLTVGGTETVYGWNANLYFNGYIDDLRITKGVARYTGNFTPPQREFLP